MKNSKPYLHLLGWAILIAAYAYLAYRLIHFDRYDEVRASFESADNMQYMCLLLAVLLFPMNQLLESLKWRLLVRKIEPLSIAEAQRQVYFGMTGAFFTPYRVGDYPTRVLLMRNKEHWLEAIGLALVGSLALTLVIEIVGLVPLVSYMSGETQLPWRWIWMMIALCLVLFVALPWLFRWLSSWHWRSERIQELMARLAEMSYVELLRVMGWSALRYACFAVQLYLVLRFVGISLSVSEALWIIPLYYLLVTITPSVPAAEVGVRGSWAAILFDAYTTQPTVSAILAVTLLWGINQVLPLLVGSVVRKRNRAAE